MLKSGTGFQRDPDAVNALPRQTQDAPYLTFENSPPVSQISLPRRTFMITPHFHSRATLLWSRRTKSQNFQLLFKEKDNHFE